MIIFKPQYWFSQGDSPYKKDNSFSLNEKSLGDKLLVTGITNQNEKIVVLIHSFSVHCYVKLPDWFELDNDFHKNQLTSKIRCQHSSFLGKKNLIRSEPMKVMRLDYESNDKMGISIHSFLKFDFEISGHKFKFTFDDIFENNVSFLLKFNSKKKIAPASWTRILAHKPFLNGCEFLFEDSTRRMISVKADDLEPCSQEEMKVLDSIILNRKFSSFDIEAYSKNRNSKLPDPSIPENVAFQISVISGFTNKPERNKTLISIFEPGDIEGVKVVRCKDEKELLLAFKKEILEEDPDYILGYNTLKFDWPYLLDRAKLNGILQEFCKMGIFPSLPCHIDEQDWESDAYGKQKMEYPNCHGRINIDLLLEVVRNFPKMVSHTLDNVSFAFLGEKKEDINHKQLNAIYASRKCLEEEIDFETLKKKVLDELKVDICRASDEIMRIRKNIVVCMNLELLLELVNELIRLVGIYCMKDSYLVVSLFNKFGLDVVLDEFVNVFWIPISFWYTRGQGIKVLSQLYEEGQDEFVFPVKRRGTNTDTPQGAYVMNVEKPGCARDVATLDFESLYPSMIMTYNACYTTHIKKEDWNKNSESLPMEWEEHICCEHDPEKQENIKKKKSLSCGHKEERYTKPFYDEDGILRGEGLLPKLERKLTSKRKLVKNEMQEVSDLLDMNLGGSKAQKLVDSYKSRGKKTIEPGTLTDDEVKMYSLKKKILDARQLALKVSANSAYGATGSRDGQLPFFPEVTATTTAGGRNAIKKCIEYINQIKLEGLEKVHIWYGDTDSLMIELTLKEGYNKFKISREMAIKTTHYVKTWILGVKENEKVETVDGSFPIQTVFKEMPKMNREEWVKYKSYHNLPVNFAYEKLYKFFLILKKKNYYGEIEFEDGSLKEDIKGLITRTRCKFIQETMIQFIRLFKEQSKPMTRKDLSSLLSKFIQPSLLEKIKIPDRIERKGIEPLLETIKEERMKELGISTEKKDYQPYDPYYLEGNLLHDLRLELWDKVPRTMKEVGIEFVLGKMRELVSGLVKDEDLLMRKNIKDLTAFIDWEKSTQLRDITRSTIKIDDPRIVFKNLQQAQLAGRMIRRGEVILPNTRIEYVFVENENEVEDYSFYKENTSLMYLNYVHYYEHQFMNNVVDILLITFDRNIKSTKKRTLKKLRDELKEKILACPIFPLCKAFEKERTWKKKCEVVICWDDDEPGIGPLKELAGETRKRDEDGKFEVKQKKINLKETFKDERFLDKELRYIRNYRSVVLEVKNVVPKK
jgi:DNA polymerase elongation subunit (family B)